MRVRRVLVVASLASGVAASLLETTSCTSFNDDGSTADGATAADVEIEAGPIDGQVGSDADGGPRSSRAACPPPMGATKPVAALSRRLLYAPPAPSFPFGLSADATHVTWTEQADDPDAGGDPYQGRGLARILRVPKAGGPAKVLARDQASAVSVVVDDGFAYWATFDGNGATVHRVPLISSCDDGACLPPETIATVPSLRLTKLVRWTSGTFLLLADDGQLFYLVGKNPPARMTGTGYFADIALTGTHAFVSTELSKAVVQRTTVSATPVVDLTYLTPPPLDGGFVGVGLLATDCKTLYMTRHFTVGGGSTLYQHDFAKPGSFDKVTQLPHTLYHVVADTKHLYIASPGAGVFALDHATKNVEAVYSGNVFQLEVDDQGVYFGEHVGPQSGTIYMLIKD